MPSAAPKNLGSLFHQTASSFPQKKAIFSKAHGKYSGDSWAEFEAKVRAIATGLSQKGLVAGDKIAILSENRPEWALVDLAAQTLGAVTVPIYPSLTSPEIEYILKDSASSFVAVSVKSLFEKITPILGALPWIQGVIGFDSGLAIRSEGLKSPLLLIRDLEKTLPDESFLNQKLEEIQPSSVASIIYTSGTTGFPKGAMLTHANFIHNVISCHKALKMGESDAHLSFLPLCHVFERTAGHYLMIYIGASIAYAENMDTVPQNLLEVKPTFILGVPRFYEKIRDRVLEAVDKASPMRKGLFFWARALRDKPGISGKWQRAIAAPLVYKKFQSRLGGRVRFCISGGAPLSKDIAEFFYSLGVIIYEGYGLTETSPVICANRQEKYCFGSVGIPIDGVEVKIAQDGEIITRSPSVMLGYYNKPEETRAVIDADGWLHTGDLGRMDHEMFLFITGRKKELIVTSGGKKISPRPIEELLESDPWIVRCVLFGEGKNFITALLVPHREKLLEFAAEQKIAYQNYTGLLKDEKIYQFFDSKIWQLTESLANYEKIKYFALLENDFTQNSGELTPTLKVRREAVLSRYKGLLLPFYEKERAPF